MRTNVKITEESYNNLCNSTVEEKEAFVLGIAKNTIWQPAGYGFYSPMIFESNGHYYASWEHSNSCD